MMCFSHARDRAYAAHALFPKGKQSFEFFAQAYKRMTEDLLKDYSYTIDGIPGKRVDIVGSVINLATVRWAADYLVSVSSFLYRFHRLMGWQMGVPLKTKADPKGLFTEQEVYDMLSLMFTSTFLNVQPEHSWTLEHGAVQVAKVLQNIIAQNVKDITPAVRPSCLVNAKYCTDAFASQHPVAQLLSFVSSFIWPTETRKPYHEFLERLQESRRPMREIVAQVFGLAIGGSMTFAQTVAQTVDFYMDDERAAERAEIIRLAEADSKDPEQQALLMGYIREAQSKIPRRRAQVLES